MKKLRIIAVTIALIGSLSSNVFAQSNTEIAPESLSNKGRVIETDRGTLLKSTIINKDGSIRSVSGGATTSGELDMVIQGEQYDYGMTMIDDYLTSASGVTTQTYQKGFTSYDTFKAALITLGSNLPKVGTIFAKGAEIYSALRNVYTDMNYIDPSRDVKVTTEYSSRYFYHYLKIWGYNNHWEDRGYSLSKYYYKHLWMRYYSANTGDYYTKAYDFTYTNGYSPFTIAKAPNYKNYTFLSNVTYERWLSGLKYYETY